MRVSFQEELDELESSLRIEGELVLRSLRGAVEAVCSQDLELADEVIAFDDDIESFIYTTSTRSTSRSSRGSNCCWLARRLLPATCVSCSRS